MAPTKTKTGPRHGPNTVEDLIAELTDHFLSSRVRVWIRGDSIAVPIEAVERSVVEDGLVYLEIELK